MSDSVLSVVGYMQIGLAVIIGALALNETRYFYDLWQWSKDDRHTERSWLLYALLRLTITIVAACGWFIIAILARLAFGPQWWATLLSSVVLILVLLQPRLLGREFRRRRRLGLRDNEKE